MKLTELCNKFDQYEIVDTQIQIDRKFYSIHENIFTDGTISTSMSSKGYVRIDSTHDANYLMFIDTQHKIYLCIYKYISETKFKEILRNKSTLRKILDEFNTDKAETENYHIDSDIHIEDDLIDINEFICTECSSEEKMKFTRSKTNPDVLETRCEACRTEYSFVPSKYYKLSSKRLVYFKSETTSRKIDLDEKPKQKNLPPDPDICKLATKVDEIKKNKASTSSTKVSGAK